MNIKQAYTQKVNSSLSVRTIFAEKFERDYSIEQAIKEFLCEHPQYANRMSYLKSCARIAEAMAKGMNTEQYFTEQVFGMLKQWRKEKQAGRGFNYGIYGDLLEMTICYIMRKGFMPLKDLHVKSSGKIDFVYHGQPCEIGHNGKTFTQAVGLAEFFTMEELTPDMIFANEPDYIIYGCLYKDHFDTLTDWVDYVSNHMYFFTKAQFIEMLTNVKKKGFSSAIRPLSGQGFNIRYNNQFYADFTEYMEKSGVPTISEIVNGEG